MATGNWRTYSEIVGIFAIVLSLILLGYEIRQNTLAVRATAIQDATILGRQQILALAMDADLARIDKIGDVNPANLNPDEAARYFWFNRSFWHGMQGNYRQWVLGLLPAEEWHYYGRVICANYREVGTYELWQIEKEVLIPAFVQFVETCDPPKEN
jgi:hypothetical protein